MLFIFSFWINSRFLVTNAKLLSDYNNITGYNRISFFKSAHTYNHAWLTQIHMHTLCRCTVKKKETICVLRLQK